MHYRPLVALILAGSAVGAAAQGLPPDAAGDSVTLRKIRASGVVSIGYREGSVPFSYLDDRQRPIGYTLDICYRIVAAIRDRLQLPTLDVRMVPVTPATRIPLVANGTVDLECGVTTNTPERQKQVGFTVTTFVAAGRVLWKKSSGLATIDDLRGKAVVSTVSTTNIKYLDDLNGQRGMGLRILAAKDDAEAFRMVQTDRAAAYAMDDVLLRSAIASAQRPADYAVSDEALSVEPYAVMIAKGDAGFKKLADDAIVALFRSGDIRTLYRNWFQSPLPPTAINLQLPMSAALDKAIAHPTDSGDPAAYR